MKQTFTLIALMICVSFHNFSFGAADSKLHLDLFNDGDFVVQIDGIRYQNVRNGIDINGLNPGTHRIRIIEVFYGRANRNRGKSVLYNGSINIPFRSAVFARLTNTFQLRITEIRRLPAPASPRYNRNPSYDRGRGYNRGNSGRGYSRGRGYGQNITENNGFDITKNAMKDANWDKEKLILAKDFAKSGARSSEISSLMNLLTFEKSKLELAKFAYPFIIDKQNISLITRSFGYDSSVKEFRKFTTGKERR